MYPSACWTASRHATSVPVAQVKSTGRNRASLPPTEMVTWVVALLSAPSCLLSTSAVVAPLQATKLKEVPG